MDQSQLTNMWRPEAHLTATEAVRRLRMIESPALRKKVGQLVAWDFEYRTGRVSSPLREYIEPPYVYAYDREQLTQALIEFGYAPAIAARRARIPGVSIARKQRYAPRGERLKQILVYLREHGPATRREVAEATQIPEGTVANFFCRQNPLFVPIGEGRWTKKT